MIETRMQSGNVETKTAIGLSLMGGALLTSLGFKKQKTFPLPIAVMFRKSNKWLS
jgi:hypothetical protein